MTPRNLPPAASAALGVLRRGLDAPAPGAPAPADFENPILSWLTRTGLGSAYRASLARVPHHGHSAPFLAGLEALKNGARARNMVLFAELGRILDAARAAGIEVMPMKGVAVVARIFGGDITMRPMADLDLLVRPRAVEPFHALLADLGYVEGSMPMDPFVGERGRHAPIRHHPRRQAAVEVHRSADYRFPGMGAELFPDFFEEPAIAAVDGRQVLLPDWPAWFCQWAVHCAYVDVYLGKMRDLYDVAVLLRRRAGDVDWDAVFRPERTAYLLRPLAMGFRLVEGLFGQRLPDPWRHRLFSLARHDYPLRELPEWLARRALFDEDLDRTLPVSVLAALSMPMHVPGWIPRFAGAFLRVFIAPPVKDLARQYGTRPGPVATPFLYARRTAHLVAIVADRLGGKLRRRRPRPAP